MKGLNVKKIVLFLLLVVVLVYVTISIDMSNKRDEMLNKANYELLTDGTKINTSIALNKEKTFEGLEIKNIRLTEKSGQSMLLAILENNTESDLGEYNIDIVFIDFEGNEINKISSYIEQIKSNEEGKLTAAVTLDLTNAYDFKIVKK